MTKNIKILERIYFSLLVVILLLIVFNNYLVSRSFTHETMTSIVLSLGLFAAAYIVYGLYRREVAKNLEELENLKLDKQSLEEKIDEAFKYIGQLNIQIEEIRSVFSEIRKYPESKSELKFILDFLAGKVLAMTDAAWACFKVVEPTTNRILIEHCKPRGQDKPRPEQAPRTEIPVSALLKREAPAGTMLIWPDQENLNLRVFCILPVEGLTKEQRVFIKAIVNQLEMFYLIFSGLCAVKAKPDHLN